MKSSNKDKEDDVKRRVILVITSVALVLGLLLSGFGCAGEAPPTEGPPTEGPPTEGPPTPPPAPDKILAGAAISLSGANAMIAGMMHTNNYEMWVEEVNERGGIYVKEYDKRIPVELIMYDDKSDISTAVKLVEKLLVEDKVDLLFSPWGTAFNFAVAPVATKYGCPLIGSTVQSEKVFELIHEIPYFFHIGAAIRDNGESLVDLCAELGIERVALIYVADEYGIEYASVVGPALGVAGIDIAVFKSYPLGVTDLSLLLKEIKTANVDALLAMSYPDDSFLITQQSMVIGLNPELFYLGIGPCLPAYRDAFGADVVDGVLGTGNWSPRVPYPGAEEYFDRYLERWGIETDLAGGPLTYAGLQVLEQAVEIAGTLDKEKITEALNTETFSSICGDVKFEGNFNIYANLLIGQWQEGEFEIVEAKEVRTAEPLFPKPVWP